MSIQKKRKSGAHSFLEIIQQHQQLREYFQQNSKPQDYASLAVQLLKESIKIRTSDPSSKPKDKHYHVAYIKHNRFLSPSQRQEVTEKITQILPVNQKPVKIYAKPRPKDDEGSNYERCIEEVQERVAEKEDNKCLKQNYMGRDDQSQKYLSPKVDRKTKEYIRPTKDKPRVNPYNSPKQRQPNPQQHKLTIQSNCKPSIKQPKPDAPIFSPRVKQNYDKVQSRIKFLIERDKQNKKVEKMLEKQNKKIEKLEERQERLLLLQYEQERQLSRNNKIQQYMKEQLSDSEESDSLEQRHPYHKQHQFQHQLDHINSRAQYSRANHSALPSNISIPKDKTYKLNSQPIYALTSSSSSDLNDYQ